MSFTLLIPVAADSPSYREKMPYLFTPNEEGIMYCVKAILGLNLNIFDSIYFIILRSHSEQYLINQYFKLNFERLGLNNASVLELEKPTNSQAETICSAIQHLNITGSIYIKDADGYFEAEVYPENSVSVYPIEKIDLLNPYTKSYVNIDDLYCVTNIIEKRVVSHYINSGGIGFENVKDYLAAYADVRHYTQTPCISHIVYSLLLNGLIFRPVKVKKYVDWGDETLYILNKQILNNK